MLSEILKSETVNAPDASASDKLEFIRNKGLVSRSLSAPQGQFKESLKSVRADLSPEHDFFVSYLAGKFVEQTGGAKRLNYIDLFCGGGGLSLGVHSAAEFLGFKPRLVVAADIDAAAVELVKSHFNPLISRVRSVEEMVKYEVDLSGTIDDFITHPQILDAQIAQLKNRVDLIVGGPPCQGHSNLNNKTRRFDPRNLLYFIMPAFVVALNIPSVIIENVRTISQAHEDVVGISRTLFEKYGYTVEEKVLHAHDFGVAQSRSRHFFVARRNGVPRLDHFESLFKVPELTFSDACMNMPSLSEDLELLELNSNLSEDNIRRINYLHDNDVFDLPNFARPECHQDGTTYQSVYGRIRKELPMTTITTGFGSPGRGRYVHPIQRRVINIREAGRAQAFPDWYWKNAVALDFKRANYQKIVGDAVPSLLAYPLVASALLE